MAALQVLQWGVCDQGAVVQLDHLQTVVSAGAATEVSDAIVRDQLAVRQALRECSISSITQLFARGSCCLVLVNAAGMKYVLSGRPTLTRTCKRGQWIDSWMSVPSVIWSKNKKRQTPQLQCPCNNNSGENICAARTAYLPAHILLNPSSQARDNSESGDKQRETTRCNAALWRFWFSWHKSWNILMLNMFSDQNQGWPQL